MKKSPQQTAISLVLPKHTSLNILRYGMLTAPHSLCVTDLDHCLHLRNMEFPEYKFSGPVLFDISLYLKSGNMAAAVAGASSMDIKDFPGIPEPGTVAAGTLPENLLSLVPAVSDDIDRAALRRIAIRADRREAVATDGHVLFLRKLEKKPLKSFLIDVAAVKIAAVFADKSVSVTMKKNEKGEYDYVTLRGESWTLTYKVECFRYYPAYNLILCDRKQNILEWDSRHVDMLHDYIERMRPFMLSGKGKSSRLYFSANTGYCRNKNLNFSDTTDFPLPVFPVSNNLISVNADKLEKILKFIGDEKVGVTVGETPLQQIQFGGKMRRALLMPLRVTGGTDSAKWIDKKEIDSEDVVNYA